MKRLKILTIGLFALIVLLPVILFNFKPNTVSEIDNRMLQENPFSAQELEKGGDLSNKIVNYVNDRIGLRDEMILSYTVLNDRLFGEMVHRTYCYGTDGYVFFKMRENKTEEAVYTAFADMVAEMQRYCQSHDVPFLFVFNPAKTSVLTQYLPKGVNYDRSAVDGFIRKLEERKVNFVDLTVLMREKTEAGEVVFNRQYDAGHWSDLGAYYGVNAMIEALQKDFPSLRLNSMDDFEVSEALQTTLPVSEFPIAEYVPAITVPTQFVNKTAEYASEVQRNPSFQAFGYYVNEERQSEGAPRVLMFQGSHMNNLGQKYMINACGEYIYVHNYQNVLNLDYYFQIFQPECVIFEVAETSFYHTNYFDHESVRQLRFNPPAPEPDKLQQSGVLRVETIDAESGERLTTICWTDASGNEDAVWAVLGDVFDMKKTGEGYQLTVENEVWRQNKEALQIIAQTGTDYKLYR